MGRVKRGTKSVSTFRPKRIPDPPVLVQGQLWKHRLSTKVSPYVTVDKIDVGEVPPTVYYYCLGKDRNRVAVKAWLKTMPLPEFLRVYEYQHPRRTVPRKKKPAAGPESPPPPEETEK